MKIQVGEIFMDKVTEQRTMYTNKTKKYLLPCLKEYGTDFSNKLSNVFKVAAGIGDIIVFNSGFKHEKHIFILLDPNVKVPISFQSFLEWLRNQPMYEDDYVYGNIQKLNYHMIVIKFPEQFWDSFETFKIGKYSQMFDQEAITKFFANHPKTQKVFIKDHNYQCYFITKINGIYGSPPIKENEWDGELDFPPLEDKEVFNHHLKKKS